MEKRYIIKENGHREIYVSLETAMAVCWEMAYEQAEIEGIDSAELGKWGDSDESGYGVCPPNDTGAYWPQVSVEDERGRTPYQEDYMTE